MKHLIPLFFLFCACQHAPVTPPEPVPVPSPAPELAAPIPCLDALGLGDSKPYCDNLSRVLDGTEMLGAFINEPGFGDALPCVTRLVDERKLRIARLQGLFIDGHRFDASPAGLRRLASMFTRAEPLARRIPVYASVACEQGFTKAQATEGCKYLNVACPHCICVNVPLLSLHGALINSLNECHGKEYCQGAASLDGTDPNQVNMTAWKGQRRSNKYNCVWRHELSRKKSLNDPTPRALRKVVPTVGQLRELIGMSK